MFVKIICTDRLVCFADFVRMTLLAVLFLLPLPNCFLRSCFSRLFVDVLKFFPPLTTSAFSGTAIFTSQHTSFESGTAYLRKNGIAIIPISCASAPFFKLSTKPSVQRNLFVQRQPYCNVFRLLGWNWLLQVFPKHKKKTSDADKYKGSLLSPLVSPKSKWILWKEFLSNSFNFRLLKFR